MKTQQRLWTATGGWSLPSGSPSIDGPQLVLVFGARPALSSRDWLAPLRAAYPGARVLGCSTAGEIMGGQVLDDSIVATAIRFDRSRIAIGSVSLAGAGSSDEAGRQLARMLPPEGLVHAFVLSDGLKVNGSELVAGLVAGLPPGVAVTGGLSADGGRFEHTVLCLDQQILEGEVAVLGMYGDSLRIGHGSMGGWDPFGPERLVTRSTGNVLYEVDGQSALALYKKYLGPHADELPSSGLLFPLALRTKDSEGAVVRTILSVDEVAQSMTFAGDVPEGGFVRLMKANFERLIDGATEAARGCQQIIGSQPPELAILISCVGRKLVLKQRIEEEVESVRGILGEQTVTTGFYSYGEISPLLPDARCALHNQTMTITTFSEL